MNEKRRRLLMSNQVQIKTSDNPVTACPNDGIEYGDDASGYDSYDEQFRYCDKCGAITKHYNHNYTDDMDETQCDTTWCTVCGTPLCSSCDSNRNVSQVWTECAAGVNHCHVWWCSQHGYVAGDQGEDHVDCKEGETCPNCDAIDSFSNVYKTCSKCGKSYYETTCSSCGYVKYTSPHNCSGGTTTWSCPECGSTETPTTVTLSTYHPDGQVTCPVCNTVATTALQCADCGALICPYLEEGEPCTGILRSSSGEWATS